MAVLKLCYFSEVFFKLNWLIKNFEIVLGDEIFPKRFVASFFIVLTTYYSISILKKILWLLNHGHEQNI